MDATIIWDDEPGANVEHIAEHGLTPGEVDEVLIDRWIRTCKFEYTTSGKYIIVVWEEANDNPRVIYSITAYEVPEPA